MAHVNGASFSVSLVSMEAPFKKQIAAITQASEPNPNAIKPYELYNGGYATAHERGVCIRIANGTAGQIGLIRAWADAFIQHMVNDKGVEPFEIAWYLGDTTDSLALLAAGDVDMSLTYTPAAEIRLIESGAASERLYVFRDRFALVGPSCNPADLREDDSIYTMFHKILTCGNADVGCPPDPDVRPACRFLSRFDKSATNIKESQIWLSTGSVPWGHDYCRWYHQYVRFPREALRAASVLSEYTLMDYGAWLSAPDSVVESMKLFKMGTDAADDVLLNPAHLVYGTKVPPKNQPLCREFYGWVLDPHGGLAVTLGLEKKGCKLYSKAP